MTIVDTGVEFRTIESFRQYFGRPEDLEEVFSLYQFEADKNMWEDPYIEFAEWEDDCRD